MDRGTDSSGTEPELNFQHFTVVTVDGHPLELGRGAMGITYKAIDRNLRMPVALKVINGAVLTSESAKDRFMREARSAAALRHPHVAAVFFLGEQDGNVFYAMEFVDGETVEAFIRREGEMPAAVALRIVSQVASALAAAEKEGIIHRDIKPSNIMLVKTAEGALDVKVIDFGLAKSIESAPDSATVTLTQGGFLGTPHFASPEQLEEGNVDTRSDIYSLGVTLFYMLAGKTPFSGSMAQVMSQHLYRQPPIERLENQPPAVMALLSSMLAKPVEERPQSALDLKQRADACLEELAGAPSSPSATARPAGAAKTPFETVAGDAPTSRGVRAALLGMALLVVALLLVAGIGFVTIGGKSKPAEVSAATPSPSPAPTAEGPPTATPLVTSEPNATPTPGPPSPQDAYAAEIAHARDLESVDDGAALSAFVKLAAEHPDDADLKGSVLRIATKIETDHPSGLDGEDFARLRPALEAAGWMGNPNAQVLLADALDGTDPKLSLYWWESAARQGRTDAMVQAGLMLSNGAGVPAPDLGGAVAWFDQAAKRNDANGMTLLADCHLRGKGTNVDPERAVDLLTTAVALGNDRAMDLLGRLYQKGTGVEADLPHAAALFQRASDAGNLNASANLGVLLMTGQGVPQDTAKAVALWKTGAEKRFPLCMFLYARSLEDPAVGNDPAAARRWYVDAAKAGSHDAMAWCEKNHVPLDETPVP